MQSLWSQTVEMPTFPSLQNDVAADVAVIGGGIAGLLTAYKLQKRGLRTVVLERGRVCRGVTQNTTAKVTAQHRLIYSRLEKQFGPDAARMYANANADAVDEYRALIAELEISCAWEDMPSYVYSLDSTDKLTAELETCKRLQLPVELVDDTELPLGVAGALRWDNQGQFHPLLFLKRIAESLTIFENTQVSGLEGQTVQTTQGNVKAKDVVVCTHFPMFNAPGFFFLRMHQERSYVVAAEMAKKPFGTFISEDDKGLSFRSHGGYLLLGGEGHRTGDSHEHSAYDRLAARFKELYPGTDICCRWSAQDCVTADGLPYAGLYSKSTPHRYVATGFGKWGMTNAMAAAGLIAGQIAGEKNELYGLYDPQRFDVPASAKNLAVDTGHTVAGLAANIAIPHDKYAHLKPGQGGIVEYDGHKAGVYLDLQGDAHAIRLSCTHLGCQLAFNRDELSWDCPCHGSRYDVDGRLLDGPAQRDQTVYG